ncbi:hypothetical protein [Lactobacillus delbrueckii]|uniref:hypothetical protein n=1 Tax=Lactobacillus delbrueckii TaxID=1584 RepID=UPI00128BC6D4|nr:hypothetical protein [Lactobacillus delbrueckii]MCD5455959.1 hypothetical protein [Lactobacillus delbrueckii subsp. bulgaricus]MCD5476663.1 hypothetical protein [Lactobacillus delbrueckii subsp. bulgaricus]MPW12674.1 hypothetical protein [Lactobacillus delbrueckii]QIE61640.1 hypothetical protein G5B51_04110 [Lactobacillus delbrueckii subsp. bulgaricus]QPB64442.1 hypothetical protein GFB67_04075 [Lactobacillus delbrueckii]
MEIQQALPPLEKHFFSCQPKDLAPVGLAGSGPLPPDEHICAQEADSIIRARNKAFRPLPGSEGLFLCLATLFSLKSNFYSLKLFFA